MKIKNYKLKRNTKGFCDIHDLTDEARKKVAGSGIEQGQVTFFVVGSTAGLTTVEYEPGLIKDLKAVFEKIAPQGDYYHHEETYRHTYWQRCRYAQCLTSSVL